MKNIYYLLLTLAISSLSFGQELMLNGDFESWDDSTTPTSYSKAESTMQETVEFYGGANSAKHTGGTKDIAQTVTGIIPGETYTISLWYKFEIAGNARMWSTWKAGTTPLADNADVLSPSTYLDNTGTTWAEYTHTLVAPATADSFYFEVRTYGSTVVYWDDFSVFKEAAGPTAPVTNAPTPEAREAGDVISIYSDEYSSIAVSDSNPNWGQSGYLTLDAAYDPTGEGTNTVLAYTSFDFQGTELVTQNALSMEYLHVDVWTATVGAVLKVTPINNGTGVTELLVNVPLVNAGWSSVDIPKASFVGMTWDSVFQLKFDGQAGTTPSDVYIDNVFFWRTLPDTTPPVITLEGANPQELTVGDAYVELGATATDDTDGDISASIVTDATAVDTAIAGSYSVTYNVSDAAGNLATEVVRTVTVEAASSCAGATALTIGTQQCGNTNEFGDLFDDSACLGSYDGGDDYIFSYTATTTGDKLDLTITGQLGYTGFAMSQGCPEGGAGTCVGLYVSYGTGNLNFESEALIAGEVYYIQISTYPSPQSTDFCLDAVLVPAPSCFAPTDLEVAAIGSTSANLTWTASASNETAWNIEYGADGFTQGDGSGTTVAVTANPYAFTGLTPNTSYDVYLQANCGAGDTSVWAGPLSFTTLCVTEIPDYIQGFDPYTGVCWTEATGPIAGPTAGTSSSNWTQDDFANTDALGQSARINIYGTEDKSWLISPTFDLSSGGYEINLDAALTLYGGTAAGELNGDDAVHVMQSLDGGSTWSSIHTWDASNIPSNVGDNVTIDVSTVTISTVKFALFAFEDTSGNGDFDFFIDNFAVRTPPSCFAPAANSIEVTYLTNTSADLSWTASASNETAWNIEYGADGFTQGDGSGTTVAVTINPYALMFLTANTSYDFYVQADCGGNGTSAWVGPFAFTTLCDAVTTFPWTEDFESIMTPSLPSCWYENNNNADSDSWITYGTYGTSDSKSAGLYTDYNIDGSWSAPATNNDDYLILPQFALTGNERLKFSVRSRNNGEPNDYKVVLSTSSNAPADFTTDLTALTVATATHTEQVIDLSFYSGNVYIAIHVPADGLDGYYLYVDDFTVEAIPSCLQVTDLAATNLTITSADLIWTAGAIEAAWNIEYGAIDFAQGEGTTVAVTANPYALTGLSANTSYDVYVQADCGANGTSAWVGPFAFTTECDAVTVFPYTEDFDTDWSCWTVNNADGDTYTWSQSDTYITPRSGASTAHGMGSNNDYLITPKFTLSGNKRVVWYDIVESEFRNNAYDVLLSTTGKEILDFTVNLGTYDCTNTSWTEHILDLSAYSGDVYIALHQTYSAATNYGFGVDDFTVEEIPSCLEVTDLAVTNLTDTSADLSWTASASNETAWNIEYGADGFTQGDGSGTTVAVTTNTYALMGLTANTSYDFYVQADCGGNDTSAWAGPITFVTPCVVPRAVPYFEGFESGYTNDSSVGGCLSQESIEGLGTWTANNTLTSYNRAPRTGDWNAYVGYNNEDWLFISVDLTADMSYTASVYARQDGTTASNSDVTISYGASASAPAMTNAIVPATGIVDGDYQLISGAFTPTTSGTHVIGIKGYMNGSPFYISLDDFSITSTPLGLEDVNTKSNFTYFPNPVNNVLSIKAQASIDSITVYNMLGQTVVRSTPNTATTAVDMSGLQTGAYFVQVAINNSIETVRVIKN